MIAYVLAGYFKQSHYDNAVDNGLARRLLCSHDFLCVVCPGGDQCPGDNAKYDCPVNYYAMRSLGRLSAQNVGEIVRALCHWAWFLRNNANALRAMKGRITTFAQSARQGHIKTWVTHMTAQTRICGSSLSSR